VLPPNGLPRSGRKLMSDESTAHDLVELSRRLVEAVNVGDFDTMLSFFAPDAVWEGFLATREGGAAIRDFFEDWFASYEELRLEQEEGLDLGNGVGFAVLSQRARLVGSSGNLRYRNALVAIWVAGLIERVTLYTDINEARAAAEQLAEERG
jgi:ketosteroid isomerase-like protein